MNELFLWQVLAPLVLQQLVSDVPATPAAHWHHHLFVTCPASASFGFVCVPHRPLAATEGTYTSPNSVDSFSGFITSYSDIFNNCLSSNFFVNFGETVVCSRRLQKNKLGRLVSYLCWQEAAARHGPSLSCLWRPAEGSSRPYETMVTRLLLCCYNEYFSYFIMALKRKEHVTRVFLISSIILHFTFLLTPKLIL